ncbi:tetratricopeptide repeat protein [Pseudomonas sp. HK3]
MECHHESEKAQTYLPLAKSELLMDQTQYYKEVGVEAWNNKLPYHATNNNFAAHNYLQLLIALIKDRVAQSDYVAGAPFYVLEIGAGTGALAYRIHKQFERAKSNDAALTNVKLVYVLSDVAEKNIEFWHAHPQLTPLFEQGFLESAHVNVLASTPIQLHQSGKILSRDTLKNPLLVISNYLFDTLPQDVYRIEKQQLQIGMLATGTVLPPGDNVPLFLDELGEQFYFKDFYFKDCVTDTQGLESKNENHKHQAIKQQILQDYQRQYTQMGFTFPTGGLEALTKLNKRIDAPLVWLVADKGTSESQLFNQNGYRPALVRHDTTWSLDVNLHALAQASAQLGGSARVQNMNTTAITQAAFFLGVEQAGLPRFSEKIENTFNNQSLGHGNQAVNAIRRNSPPPYHEFIAHWQQSQYDLALFCDYWPVLKPYINKDNQHVYPELWAALPELVAGYFAHPGDSSALLAVVECYMAAEDWSQALEVLVFNLSLNLDCVPSLFLRAVCLAKSGQGDKALDGFKALREKDSEDIEVLGWCRKLVF